MQTPRFKAAVAPGDDNQQARRVLARAMVELGRSGDPLRNFQDQEELIHRAMLRLGRRRNPEPIPEPGASPTGIILAFQMVADGVHGEPIEDVRVVGGNAAVGFNIAYDLAGKPGEPLEAFALAVDGEPFFAPGPVGPEDVEAVQRAFCRHFDFTMALALNRGGSDAASIDRRRAAIRPLRVLWPHERDPAGLCDEMPMVFVLHNDGDDGRTFYCGYDPFSDETRPYDHR